MMPDATQVVVFSFLAGALVALYSACLAGFRIARTRLLPSLGLHSPRIAPCLRFHLRP